MLESLLANTDSTQPWLAFVRNIAFGALLAMLLEQVYTRYGHSLSNRSAFARHFYLLTMTTTLIITVVQSSLALSLGLIGALSIVRFRAAIKEPEELVYIFLAVAIGLGLGANQLILTLTAVATIVAVVWLRHLISVGEVENESNVFFNVTTHAPDAISIPVLTRLLEAHCLRVRLKRVDTTAATLDASFLVEVPSADALQTLEQELRRLDANLTTTVIDYRTDVGTV